MATVATLPTTPPSGGVFVWASRAALLLALVLAACAEQAEDVGDAAARDGVVAIGQVQGRDAQSPLRGRRVAVEGVVTGNFVRGLGGFFVQDTPDAVDDDAATSDALFVEWTTDRQPVVRAGDRVHVAGQVDELGRAAPDTLTSLRDATVHVLGRGSVPPRALDGPPPDWEALEGMSVEVTVPLTVTGNHGLARFGELAVAFGDRLRAPTEVALPGEDARRVAADNARRRLLLDDHRDAEYPERLWQLTALPDAQTPLRAGSVVDDVAGILDQRHGAYRVQLSAPIEVIEQAPRPPPPEVDGAVTVGVFNVLNFFNGDGRGGGWPTPRGARDPDAMQRQRDKLVAALSALSPDIVALMEIENDGDGPDSALAGLVDALNRRLGDAGDYRAVASDDLGGSDAIRVALIYREGSVTPVGEPQALLDGPFAYGSRPPLAQAFRAGELAPFAVVASHFKSKGGCGEADGADRDQGDGQACFNAARVAAAGALADWLAADPTGIAGDRVLIVGDLNSHTQEDPIRLLAGRGWRDVFALTAGDAGHTYVYAGEAGRLDHALASPGLAASVVSAAVWHANADESELFDYRRLGAAAQMPFRADPYRASDHDPLLIGLAPAAADQGQPH